MDLFQRFLIDQEFHDKTMEEEKEYSEKCLVHLLKTQISELDSHPFYSEESFYSASDYQRWKKVSQKRIETCLERFPNVEPKDFYEPTVFGATSEGFSWLLQLFVSLGTPDRFVLIIP